MLVPDEPGTLLIKMLPVLSVAVAADVPAPAIVV
jgi:hypothetical protein